MSFPQPDATPEQVAALERIEFTVGDMRVSALRSGEAGGRRIVYVHGSPGSAGNWNDFLVEPIAGSESFALDRPGFGESTSSRAFPELADQAAAVEPLLGEADEPRVLLVGHSLGGPVIAQVAADRPERVAGIVIVAGSLDPALEKRRWFNYVARGLSWVLPRMLVRSNQEIWAFREQLEQLAEDLSRVSCAVVIVHGKKDGLVPYENVAFMRSAFDHASSLRVVDFEEANHFLLWEEPYESELRAAIGELFRGVE